MRYVNIHQIGDRNLFYLNFLRYFILNVIKWPICIDNPFITQYFIYMLSYICIPNRVEVLEGRETDNPLFWKYYSDYQKEIPK